MKKLILLIIISLFLSGCLKAPPKPEEETVVDASEPKTKTTLIDEQTKDWQVYQNQKLGFKLKYPSEWYQTDLSIKANLQAGINFLSVSENQVEKDHARFTVFVEEAKDRNLENFDFIENLEKDGYEKSYLEFLNTPAYFLITTDINKDHAVIILKKDGLFYRLNWTATTPQLRQDYRELFKQIIATFEFTNLPDKDHLWI